MTSLPKDLSPEMSSLVEALKVKRQGELPGLEVGPDLKYEGHGWWRVDGAPRCWMTTTIHALLRRRILVRAAPRVLRLHPEVRHTTDG